MRRSRSLLALAVILCAGAALPAMAAWNKMGSVEITDDSTVTAYGRFGGGDVEALNFRAMDADVVCQSVNAIFANGEKQFLFQGEISRDRQRTVDLNGPNRAVRRIEFDCRPVGQIQASVFIAADFDTPRPERQVEAVPDPRDAINNDGRWTFLGRESFEGRFDRESTFAGFRGHDVDAIGLRPVNDDARCTSLTATFANGRTRELDADVFLPEDRITPVDLPGENRDVTRVAMNCRAVHGAAVTIEVMAAG